MRIRPDLQEKLFLSHLAVVALLFLLASGASPVTGLATAILRVMTFPIHLLLRLGDSIPVISPDTILERPMIAYGIALLVVPFLVINSYLWAFLFCHIKWQWRAQEPDHSEMLLRAFSDTKNPS